jgi:hypothetical protein
MVLQIRIRVSNLENVNRKFGRIDNRFRSMSMMNFGRAIANRAKYELQRSYVGRPRTGNLERSIRAISVERGRSVRIIAEATKGIFPYAVAVERGRKAIQIGAKGKKLRFIGREGRPVFTTRVGPTTGKFFMKKAADWGRAEIERYMRRRIRRIIESGGTADDYNVQTSIGV